MNDSNLPPAPTASLAELVNKTPNHPTHSGSDGSQQERNHQVPTTLHIGPFAEGSRTGRIHTDASSKTYRKPRPRGIGVRMAPDLSSLTHKDHASSALVPVVGGVLRNARDAEGSTEMIGKEAGKEARSELLEENRMLRIELERVKYRLGRIEGICRKQRKQSVCKDKLLEKYRTQLVGLFEGENEVFPRRQGRDYLLSHGNSHKHVQDERESISNSQEEDWSCHTIRSGSELNEEWQEGRVNGEYSVRKGRIRKKGRTRAPAWTREEEDIFMQAYEKHGCRWKLFQESLPGRSRRQIQSHGSYLIRQGKLLKKNSRPWQRRKLTRVSESRKEGEIDGDTKDGSEGE